MESFKQLEEQIKTISEPKKVAVINAASDHALDGVFELAKKKMVIPYLLDDETKINEMLADRDLGDTDYHVVPVHSDEESAFKGIELVREGKVDFIMKGNIQTGTLLKQVVNRETGIRDRDVLSHLALIEVPKYPKLLGVTDGGMLLAPDADQKEAVIENALEVMKALDYDQPKFAILSASESVQPKLQASVDGKELTERFENRDDCIVEGPISLDLSISPKTAEAKGYEGNIQGDADVLVAADVIGGNTLSKSMLLLADGTMAGVILGAKAPIVLTSRSSSADEIRQSLLVAIKASEM
ncbi:MAG TPA: phosphate acyltransferase [Bacillota bacterium]|nr:phosphate acyltransferase [Bacillota bacterium]